MCTVQSIKDAIRESCQSQYDMESTDIDRVLQTLPFSEHEPMFSHPPKYKRPYYIDEMHLLLKEEQTAAYTVEIWKRFRKWGGIPTGITQNVKDLLSSREVENIFENPDFV